VRIDSAAAPFVAIACVPALVALLAGFPVWGAALLALPAAVALFFRDPERLPPADPNLVVAPADGRVMYAGPARQGEAPPGEWLQVTIFLSLFDVHINRAPVGGTVRSVVYVPGSFVAAFRPESGRNEHSEIAIDHRGTPVIVRQVVGVLARRVVCRLQPNQTIQRGERIGLMKFGSRMDVFVPVSSILSVRVGSRVRAGETVLARLAPGEEAS
jgi:phosphatidylserine decarboxylase